MLPSTEETRASQPRTQSNLINNHSEDFIPIDGRKWNDIPAYGEVNGFTLPIDILMVQFIGNPCVQSCDTRSRMKADILFSDSQWLVFLLRNQKIDCNIAKTRTTTSCMFAPSKGTQEDS